MRDLQLWLAILFKEKATYSSFSRLVKKSRLLPTFNFEKVFSNLKYIFGKNKNI